MSKLESMGMKQCTKCGKIYPVEQQEKCQCEDTKINSRTYDLKDLKNKKLIQ